MGVCPPVLKTQGCVTLERGASQHRKSTGGCMPTGTENTDMCYSGMGSRSEYGNVPVVYTHRHLKYREPGSPSPGPHQKEEKKKTA